MRLEIKSRCSPWPVFFADSAFGESFGSDTLAITILLYSGSGAGVSTEADVIVNNAFTFNSYRGPLKPGDPATRVYDVHRIFLHEFGHVLGLGHPNESGQNVVAIMNSFITDLDHLADDDIEGALALYGIRITSHLCLMRR